MIIIKNNKCYAFDITPKTAVDNDSLVVKIGRCDRELKTNEVLTLITLLTNLVIGKEVKKCKNCGNKFSSGKFCSECGHKLD